MTSLMRKHDGNLRMKGFYHFVDKSDDSCKIREWVPFTNRNHCIINCTTYIGIQTFFPRCRQLKVRFIQRKCQRISVSISKEEI